MVVRHHEDAGEHEDHFFFVAQGFLAAQGFFAAHGVAGAAPIDTGFTFIVVPLPKT